MTRQDPVIMSFMKLIRTCTCESLKEIPSAKIKHAHDISSSMASGDEREC